jgi:hypothetical protein
MSLRRDRIAKRLREWICELNTNRYGLAHLAQRAIAVLQAELRQYGDEV